MKPTIKSLIEEIRLLKEELDQYEGQVYPMWFSDGSHSVKGLRRLDDYFHGVQFTKNGEEKPCNWTEEDYGDRPGFLRIHPRDALRMLEYAKLGMGDQTNSVQEAYPVQLAECLEKHLMKDGSFTAICLSRRIINWLKQNNLFIERQ